MIIKYDNIIYNQENQTTTDWIGRNYSFGNTRTRTRTHTHRRVIDAQGKELTNYFHTHTKNLLGKVGFKVGISVPPAGSVPASHLARSNTQLQLVTFPDWHAKPGQTPSSGWILLKICFFYIVIPETCFVSKLMNFDILFIKLTIFLVSERCLMQM